MADYSNLYSVHDKSSVAQSNTHPEGYRQCPLTSGSWILASGVHGCTANTSDVPFVSGYIQNDLHNQIAQMQHHLSYMYYLNHWVAATPDYVFNDAFYHNFATFVSFDILSASSNTITIDTTGVDPLAYPVSQSGGREEWFEPIEYSTAYGVFPAPGDMCVFQGNSALSGKMKAKIKSASYTANSVTLTLDQSCSYADNKLDPDGATPSVMIIRNAAKQPELWAGVDPECNFYGRYETIIVPSGGSNWDAENQITIKTSGNVDTAIAYPFVYDDWAGTIRFEIGTSGSYSDYTYALTPNDWERVQIMHDGAGAKTIINASGIVPDGADSVRITCVVEDEDRTIEGVHSPCQKRCTNCLLDRTGTVGNISTNGVDTENGRHWYCAARNITPSGNLEKFRARYCYQTDCPNFSLAGRSNVSDWHFAQMLGGIGEGLKQLGPGNSHVTNFIHFTCGTPGVYFQLNPNIVYGTNYGAYASTVNYYCGGYGHYAGITTDEDDNEDFDWVYGADWNHGFPASGLFYDTNRQPAAAEGVLAQKLGNTHQRGLQLPSGVRNAQEDLWRGGSITPPVFRFSTSYGGGHQFTNRNVPGIEGENRRQRFDRAYQTVLTDVNLEATTVSDANADYYVKTTSADIGGKSDLVGYIQLRRDGEKAHGYKRIGGAGINGRVWRVEGLGNDRYKLHCAPGAYVQHQQVMQDNILSAFFAGGNVVSLPYPYQLTGSQFNNINNLSYGDSRRKATTGDTITYANIPYAKFWIEDAEACSGDSMIGISGQNWTQVGRVGTFFDFASYRTGSEVVDITDVEIQIFSSNWQYWTGQGSPAVDLMAYEDRLINATGDSFDLAGMVLEQDRYETLAPSGASLEITDIVQGGAPSYPPVITTATPHGLAQGDNIYISGSNSYHSVDGHHIVIPIGDRDLILWEDWSGVTWVDSGTEGTLYKVGTDTIIQGDMNAYPSYNFYKVAFSTGVGLLYPNIRVHWNLDGQTQTPFDLALRLPQIQLAFDGADPDEWSVWILDPRLGDEWQEMSYGGQAIEYDMTVHTNFYVWWYDAAQNKIILHPNTAGALVYVAYKSSTNIDLGEYPTGAALIATTGDTSYMKNVDTLTVRDELGIIASNPDALTAFDFYVNTDGVIAPPENVSRSYAVEYYNAPSGVWEPINTTDYHVHSALGRIFLTEDGYAALPSGSADLRITADVANGARELPAEVMQSMVDVIGCLDTVKINGFVGQVNNEQVAGSAISKVGFSENTTTTGGFPFTYLTSPLELGLWQTELQAIEAGNGYEKVYGANYDSGVPYYQVSREIQYDPTPGPSTSDIWIGSAPVTGDFEISAFLYAPIFRFQFNDFLKKLPADSEILSAKIRFMISADAENTKIQEYSILDNVGFGGGNAWGHAEWGPSDIYYPYTAPTSPWVYAGDTRWTWTQTTDLDIAFAIAGLQWDGKWKILGSYDPGQVEPGKWRVLDFTDTLSKVLSEKNSDYVSIGLYPVNVSAGDINVSIGVTGEDVKELVVGILNDAAWSIEHTRSIDAGNNYTQEYNYLKFETAALSASSISYGNMIVQFKLPSGVIQDMRIMPTLPAMA